MLDKWLSRILGVVMLGLLGLGLFAAYRLARADARAEVYRSRLVELAREHDALKNRYNEAVKRTAVTELVVAGGKLSVVVATPEHEIRRIETPYDPKKEIHVDFVVQGGRLWIRRIHDGDTPASKALVIDPKLADIDWNADDAHGLAIYRPLGEGRWVVSITGNGALDLQPAPPKERVQLTAGAKVQRYETVADSDARGRAGEVGVVDTLKALLFPRREAPGSS